MKILRFPVHALLLVLLLVYAAAPASTVAQTPGPTGATGGTFGSRLVISQIYGGGGASGSTWTNDFVELYNPTSSDITLTGYLLQYAPSTTATYASSTTSLLGTIKAGHFFLVTLALGGSATNLPSSPVSDTTNLAATAGKLVLTTTAFSSGTACPGSPNFINFVGYGSGTNCQEQTTSGTVAALYSSTSGNAKSPTSAKAVFRTLSSSPSGNNIFLDTGNNSSDFNTTDVPTPRNGALDYLWVANANSNVSKFGGTGSLVPNVVTGTNHGATTAQSATVGGVAIDNSGRAWSVTTQSNNVNIEAVGSDNTSAITGTSVNAPSAIAIDGAGTAWIANALNNTISAISNAGTELSPGTATSGTYQKGGYGQGTSLYSEPRGVAIDLSGNVWVANNTSGTVTQILGAAAPAAPLSTALANSTVTSSAQGVTP